MERLFYVWCVNMRLEEDFFWKSSLAKVIRIVDMYREELEKGITGNDTAEVQEITSMRQIQGW